MSDSNWDIEEFTKNASQFLEKNFKAGLIIFAVLIVAASAYSYKKGLDRAAEKQAFTDLYKVTQNYHQKKEDFAKAEEQKTAAKESKKDNPIDKDLVAASGDMDKDYGDEVKGLKEFVEQNNGANASAEAALILSEIYSEYGKSQEGAEVLTQTLNNWSGDGVLLEVMQMRSGDLWASAGDCEKAVGQWRKVAASDNFISTQAQLKLGICLQKLGQLEEAQNWFEKIQAQSPNTTEGFNAKRYLRFLKFKSHSDADLDAESKVQNKSKSEDSPS